MSSTITMRFAMDDNRSWLGAAKIVIIVDVNDQFLEC